MPRFLHVTLLLCITAAPALAQTSPAPTQRVRPTPPTRDPHTPGYVTATELPDGANAPATADGNFILGPTHSPSPDATVHPDVPQGSIYIFAMQSTDSKLYPALHASPAPSVRQIPPTPQE